MNLQKIQEVLSATVLCGEERLCQEAAAAFSCDLMSDVLAYVKTQDILITGLVNPQTVRTADMLDIKCIVFVRGKVPDEIIVRMADERGIVVMHSPLTMYMASGILYAGGLKGA